MPVVGDVLEFKDFQSMIGIEGDILNVYHWRVDDIDSAIGLTLLGVHLKNWFYSDFLGTIKALQSNSLSHVRLEINNLMAYETDFYIGTPDTPSIGSVAEQFSPPQVAWSFQYARTLRTTRNGSKRIPGVPENYITNNVATTPALAAIAEAVTEMGQQWTVDYPTDLSVVLTPVIIRRGATLSVPPTAINPVSDVIYRGVGSQNTRKQLLS